MTKRIDGNFRERLKERIKAGWLPYETLKDNGMWFEHYENDIDELTGSVLLFIKAHYKALLPEKKEHKKWCIAHIEPKDAHSSCNCGARDNNACIAKMEKRIDDTI